MNTRNKVLVVALILVAGILALAYKSKYSIIDISTQIESMVNYDHTRKSDPFISKKERNTQNRPILAPVMEVSQPSTGLNQGIYYSSDKSTYAILNRTGNNQTLYFYKADGNKISSLALPKEPGQFLQVVGLSPEGKSVLTMDYKEHSMLETDYSVNVSSRDGRFGDIFTSTTRTNLAVEAPINDLVAFASENSIIMMDIMSHNHGAHMADGYTIDYALTVFNLKDKSVMAHRTISGTELQRVLNVSENEPVKIHQLGYSAASQICWLGMASQGTGQSKDGICSYNLSDSRLKLYEEGCFKFVMNGFPASGEPELIAISDKGDLLALPSRKKYSLTVKNYHIYAYVHDHIYYISAPSGKLIIDEKTNQYEQSRIYASLLTGS